MNLVEKLFRHRPPTQETGQPVFPGLDPTLVAQLMSKDQQVFIEALNSLPPEMRTSPWLSRIHDARTICGHNQAAE